MQPGDLLLIDAAAEYDHYSADVTRTFPASGKFTPAQAEVYNVVLAAQEAAFRAIKPGARLSDVHNAAAEVIKDGLLRLGLITERNSLAQNRVWFMHGTSHWLGMNVHDVSARGDDRLDTGMVFTVEPGIYVRPDALDNLPKTPETEKFIAAVRPAFEKYRGHRREDRGRRGRHRGRPPQPLGRAPAHRRRHRSLHRARAEGGARRPPPAVANERGRVTQAEARP